MDPEEENATEGQAPAAPEGDMVLAEGRRAYRVLDTESGEVQSRAAGPDLEAGLRSGRFQLSTQNSSIGLVDEQGRAYDVEPTALRDWLADGRFRLETEDEAIADEARRFSEQNPVRADVTALASGLANELTFGLAPDSDELRALREANPLASGIGSTIGIVAPAFLTGGTSLAGSGTRAGLRGLAALTPSGLAAVGGSAVERALLARFGRGATSRALATVGGAVTDGALGGVANAITQANINGTPLEAEQVFSDALFGAALGLGGGTLLASGGAALRGARRTLRGSAGASERAASYAERLASRGLGEAPAAVAPTRVQRVAAWAAGVDPEDLALIARDPARAFDADGFLRAARETAEQLGTLRRQVDDVGRLIGPGRRGLGEAVAGLDEATARATARTALEVTRDRLVQGLGELGADGRSGAARALRGVAGEVNRALDVVDDATTAATSHAQLDAVLGAIDDAAQTAGDDAARSLLAELRTSVANVAGDAAVFGPAGGRVAELDGLAQRWREARQALDIDGRALASAAAEGDLEAVTRAANALDDADEVLRAVERSGGDVTSARAALETARQRLGSAATWGQARAAAERGLRAEGGHGMRGTIMRMIGHRGAKVVGGALGTVLGGPAGGVAGAALGGLLDAGVHSVSTYRRIGQLGESIRGYQQRLDAGIARVERALSSAEGVLEGVDASSSVRTVSRVVVGLRGSAEERRAEYRHVSEEIRSLSVDPDALGDRLGASVSPVSEASPALADAMTATAVRGVTYLAEHLPAADRPTLFDFGGQLEPSQFEIDGFLRRYEAVEDPLSILDRAAEGSLRIEHREAVEAVYPEVYAEIRARLSEVIAQREERPPYAARLQLGILMGVPADRSTTPEMIAALQSHYSQTAQQFDIVHSRGSLARLGNTVSEDAMSETQETASRL